MIDWRCAVKTRAFLFVPKRVLIPLLRVFGSVGNRHQRLRIASTPILQTHAHTAISRPFASLIGAARQQQDTHDTPES